MEVNTHSLKEHLPQFLIGNCYLILGRESSAVGILQGSVKFCLSVCIPRGAVKNAVLQVSTFTQRALWSRELCPETPGTLL